jgi:hypothetical protein
MALVKIRNAANDDWIIVASTGTTGPQGEPGLTWLGAWDSGTTYDVGDAVESAGSAYICTAESTNNEPPNASYWDLLAEKGDTGATGATGDTGATGAAGEVQSADDTSTDNAIARFHGTDGHAIQNSQPTIDDTGNIQIADDDKLYLRDTNNYVTSRSAGYLSLYAQTYLDFFTNGTRRFYITSIGLRVHSGKAYDIGESAAAVDDVFADDFQNVADVPYLDDYDDLATIAAIRRSEAISERTGLPLIDDATLPAWLLTTDKADRRRVLRDERGNPWVSTNNWVGLLLGAVRELTRKADAQQAEIDALKAAVKALQAVRRA